MHRTALVARIVVASAFAVAPALALAGPAGAAITKGPCNGSATIGGTTYTPANDTEANPIIVPEQGTVAWQGTTGGAVIKNHSGSIGIVVGPGSITVADWANPNKKGDTESSGTYDLATAYEKLPLDIVGIYKVVGEHAGQGGSCEGFAMVKIDGNPLATVPGAAAAGLTVLTGAGVVAAGMAKKP